MSFEGFYQAICKNGHLFNFGVTYEWDEETKEVCPYCKEHVAWWNLVDDTNCDRAGFIHKFEELTPTVFETCQCCGHSKRVKEPTFKIPEGKGHLV